MTTIIFKSEKNAKVYEIRSANKYKAIMSDNNKVVAVYEEESAMPFGQWMFVALRHLRPKCHLIEWYVNGERKLN